MNATRAARVGRIMAGRALFGRGGSMIGPRIATEVGLLNRAFTMAGRSFTGGQALRAGGMVGAGLFAAHHAMGAFGSARDGRYGNAAVHAGMGAAAGYGLYRMAGGRGAGLGMLKALSGKMPRMSPHGVSPVVAQAEHVAAAAMASSAGVPVGHARTMNYGRHGSMPNVTGGMYGGARAPRTSLSGPLGAMPGGMASRYTSMNRSGVVGGGGMFRGTRPRM